MDQSLSPAAEQKTFPAGGGAELFYRHWSPATPGTRAIFLFHRGHEHSGRFEELVRELDLPDCHVFAWDARGHGRSPGERGYAESFATIIDDMDRFVRFICDHRPAISQFDRLAGHLQIASSATAERGDPPDAPRRARHSGT